MDWTSASPLVVQMRFAQGGQIGGQRGNGSVYAQYIAERQGVVRVAEDPAVDAQAYASYVGERPGSTGLFGADPGEPPVLGGVQAALQEAPWWQEWVISMRTPDAEAAGMGTPQAWRAMVRRVEPQLLRARGLAPEDVEWAAAVHWKVGQPHTHILVWPHTEAAVQAGPKLQRDELRNARKSIAHEVFGAMRAEMAAQRTLHRDAALRTVSTAVPGVFAKAERRELAGRLRLIAAQLPGHGRAVMAYMPPEVKESLRNTAEWLLRQEPLAADAEAVVHLAEEMATMRSGTAEGKAAGQRAAEDLRDRVAQVLLRSVVGASRGAAKRGDSGRLAHSAQRQVPSVVWAVRRSIAQARREAERASLEESEAEAARRKWEAGV